MHVTGEDALRVAIAGVVGCEPGDVALIGNAADGIGKGGAGFDWRAGDNVVAPELDYASGRFALASLKQLGVELRLVPARGWVLDEADLRSEEHTSELQSLMRISYAVFCLKKKKKQNHIRDKKKHDIAQQ